ncbi:MAG: STAS domain-containing protein [Rhodoferax sp.]|nr:STAS domain-containing protein [Rhodoferax sp.]
MTTPALPLGPELTIAFAATWRETLADAVNAGGNLTLDLGEVTDFDSAGVQLLLAARRSLAERGQRLQVATASPVVRDGLQVFGLQSLLDD